MKLSLPPLDKRAKVVFGVLAATIILFAGAAATVAVASYADAPRVPVKDTTVPRNYDWNTHHPQIHLVWRVKSQGGNTRDTVTYADIQSQDLKLMPGYGAGGPGTRSLIHSFGNTCPDKCWEFPASYVLYFPNGDQSNVMTASWAIKPDQTGTWNHNFHFRPQGFGTYELRGTISEGEINACGTWWAFSSCWVYREKPYVGKFDLEQEGAFKWL